MGLPPPEPNQERTVDINPRKDARCQFATGRRLHRRAATTTHEFLLIRLLALLLGTPPRLKQILRAERLSKAESPIRTAHEQSLDLDFFEDLLEIRVSS